MGKQLWTAERTEHAQKLWREGISASAIATRLGYGFTRNAVIGKMHRTVGKKDPTSAKIAMQFSGRMKAKAGRVRKAKAAPKPISRKPPSMFNARPPTPSEIAHSAAEWQALKAAMERQDAARSDLIALLDLEPHHCRWPIGEPTRGFCGHGRAPGSSYCAAHMMRGIVRASPTWLPKVHRSPAVEPANGVEEFHETVAA